MIYFLLFTLFVFILFLYCLCVTAKRADEELQLLMRARVQDENEKFRNL